MNRETPLHAEHVALGARMAPFAAWDMPIQYTSILEEHHWTRTACSLFDICHMGEFLVSGPRAESDLEHLLTQRISSLAVGRCRYGYLLNEAGGVLDDLLCYRLGPDRFFLVVNAARRERDAAWIRSHCSTNTRFDDVSDQWAKLDVQGPETRTGVEAALGGRLPDLPYFAFVEGSVNGASGLISRTGYTGEWGLELFVPADTAVGLWRALLATGAIKPAGLGARDTLRLEMVYSLYGHELSEERSPVSATGALFIDVEKEFMGKTAVMHDLERKPTEKLVGLVLAGRRAARPGDRVLLQDEPVGVVTSGSLAPSLGEAVALAYVRADCAEVGLTLEIKVHGKRQAATVTERPFYKKGTARALR